MELSVLPRKSIVISKILRFQGSLDHARQELERCLAILQPHDRSRYQVLCSLADTYCDLALPGKAHDILLAEVEIAKTTPTKAKPLRRLLVSIVEALIQQGRYGSARDTIQELDAMFSRLDAVDVSDEMLHMRVLLGGA